VRDAAIDEGLTESSCRTRSPPSRGVGEQELAALLRAAGFVDVDVEPHTFVDTLDGVDDLIAWSQSSSFGNFLSDLDAGELARVRARLSRKLESARTR
jgi:trans-aconitate methyltransferase